MDSVPTATPLVTVRLLMVHRHQAADVEHTVDATSIDGRSVAVDRDRIVDVEVARAGHHRVWEARRGRRKSV